MRQKGLQPKFNGMAPPGPRRTPTPAPARASQSVPSSSLPNANRNPTGFVSPAQAAAIGATAGSLAMAGGYAASGGAGLRRIGKRPPMGPFSETQTGGTYPSGGGNPPRVPGSGAPTYAPVAVGVTKKGNSPKMWAKANKGNVNVTVEHTEYIRDLSGTAAFTPTSLPINPGNTDVFAWLSDLAGLFETYRFEKLEFHYNPSVGTDTDGKLLMTFDPDVLDEVPDSKQVMLEARVQLDATPWQPSILKVPKDVLSQERYVRSGLPPPDTDQHLYDAGQLIYATPGVPVAVCGELFVTYKVVFTTPNGPQPRSGVLYALPATGLAVASPMGTSAPLPANNPGSLRPVWVSATTFLLPAGGDFMLTMKSVGTTFAGGGTIAASGDNTCILAQAAFTTTSAISEWRVKVLDPTDVFTLTSPSGAATITQMSIKCFPYDEDWP